jgi:ubiquitin-like protein Pup
MADQERKTGRPRQPKAEEVPPASKVVEKGKALKEGLEKVLDEIDTVLEENAEEFVKNYVQRGGE